MARNRFVAAIAATTTALALAGATVAATPQVAQAADGQCIEGHRTYFLDKNGPDIPVVFGGRYTAGNVGLNFTGCLGQDPSTFSAAITNQDTSFEGKLDQYQIEGILNKTGGDANGTSWTLRLIVKQCLPPLAWVPSAPCGQADEIDEQFALSYNRYSNTVGYHWLAGGVEFPSGWYSTEQGDNRPYFIEHDNP